MHQKRIVLIAIICLIFTQYVQCTERYTRQLIIIPKPTPPKPKPQTDTTPSSTTTTTTSTESESDSDVSAFFVLLIIFIVMRSCRKRQQNKVQSLNGQTNHTLNINQQMVMANEQFIIQNQNGISFQQPYYHNQFQNNSLMIQNQYSTRLNNPQIIPTPQMYQYQNPSSNQLTNEKPIPIIQTVVL